MKFVINIRFYGGTYIARVVGQNITASCTQGAQQAASRAAKKIFGDQKFRLVEITGKTFVATDEPVPTFAPAVAPFVPVARPS